MLFWMSFCIFTFAVSYIKTYAHEIGHLAALVHTDLLFRKCYSNYTQQKHTMRVRFGIGRTDSELYGIIVKKQRWGLLRFNAIAGFLSEITYCVVLLIVTQIMFRNCVFTWIACGVFFCVSFAMFLGSIFQKQGDGHIFFCPQSFKGNIQWDTLIADKSKIVFGVLLIVFQSGLIVALCFLSK